MEAAFELRDVSRWFGRSPGLDEVTLSIPRGRVVGLIGRSGAGKTTLIHHVVGLVLPEAGECRTFGVASPRLGSRELSRIGLVPQENRLLNWMTVDQHVEYVASFYPGWDEALERRLVDLLEIERDRQVADLSPGNQQKVALLLAVCHRPDLLLLDEPVSSLDPIARDRVLSFLLELLADQEMTIVISSHVLHDVEKVVDWIVCLERGRMRANASLDFLQERFAEWRVTAAERALPRSFPEPFIRRQKLNGTRAILLVEAADDLQDDFRRRHGVDVERRPLNLERIFPLLVEERQR